jgi:mannan endo-1,4-beta-mannosidase
LQKLGTTYFQSFIRGQQPYINTGPDGLQRLDYVVSAAAQRGLKVIIPFVNNWEDYGGMSAYMKYYGGRSNLDWYRSDAIQVQYQKYINIVVGRYLNNPAIFAWELANEPRCQGCNTNVITQWARNTAYYIKTLDKNHMVGIGDEGFGIPGDTSYPYGYSEGVDFEKNIVIPEIDFGTFHLYPDACMSPIDTRLLFRANRLKGHIKADLGNAWVQAHAAACKAANKPCVFEEYGLNGVEKCTKIRPWQQISLATEGMGGDMYWQAGDSLSSGLSHDDGNTVYPNSVSQPKAKALYFLSSYYFTSVSVSSQST